MDLFEHNINRWWGIFLISIPILIAFLAALRNGWLPNIASKWFRIKWIKDSETESQRSIKADQETSGDWSKLTVDTEESSQLLRDYDIRYLPPCLDDLTRLGLTQDQLINLVQDEFRSHLNYFRFDLEDYTMPVRTNYIVYLDKLSNSVTFKRVLPCTKNELKLSSWNDILAVYRKASRLAYREDPNTLLTSKGQYRIAANIHLDMQERITKHFEELEGMSVHPVVIGMHEEIYRMKFKPSSESYQKNFEKYFFEKHKKNIKFEVAFHLLESNLARNEGYDIIKNLDEGLFGPQKAIGNIVACLERSLQHLHKILILFPPIQ